MLWEFKGERTNIRLGWLKRALKNFYSWDLSLLMYFYDVKRDRKGIILRYITWAMIEKWKHSLSMGNKYSHLTIEQFTLFHQYLMSTCYEFSPLLGTGNLTMNKTCKKSSTLKLTSLTYKRTSEWMIWNRATGSIDELKNMESWLQLVLLFLIKVNNF